MLVGPRHWSRTHHGTRDLRDFDVQRSLLCFVHLDRLAGWNPEMFWRRILLLEDKSASSWSPINFNECWVSSFPHPMSVLAFFFRQCSEFRNVAWDADADRIVWICLNFLFSCKTSIVSKLWFEKLAYASLFKGWNLPQALPKTRPRRRQGVTALLLSCVGTEPRDSQGINVDTIRYFDFCKQPDVDRCFMHDFVPLHTIRFFDSGSLHGPMATYM